MIRRKDVDIVTVNIDGLGMITASEAVLNELSMLFNAAGKGYEIQSCSALAKRSRGFAHEVHKALRTNGYYDDSAL